MASKSPGVMEECGEIFRRLGYKVKIKVKDTELIRAKSCGIAAIAYSCNNLVRCECHPFWPFVGSHLLLSLSSISFRYLSQFVFFRLKLVRWGIGLIVKYICILMRIGR